MAKRRTTIEVGYDLRECNDFNNELYEFRDCIDKLFRFLESYHYEILNSYMTNSETYIISVKGIVPDFLLDQAIKDYISDSKFTVIRKADPL